MTNYYKYLPVSREDENWGLCVLNAGCNHIRAHEAYPPPGHPSHHYFNWEKGRTLNNEYQVIYITGGSGLFESSSCEKQPVREGSILILFPGEWHRFKPDEETGWDEYWVGFKGPVMNNIVQQSFYRQDAPIIHIGIKEEIVTLILSVIEYAKQENTGYQPAVSGVVLHLLGQIHAITKRHSLKEESVEVLINKARILLRIHVDQDIPLEKIAEQLNISYSSFRKMFKAYTGIAPGQYLIQLRIEKAKALLADPSKSIKQVAFDLQFESSFYFSRSFKEKTGLTPGDFRKQYLE